MEATIDTPASSTTTTPETTAPPSAPAIAPAAPSDSSSAAASPPARPTSFREALAQQETKSPTETPVVPPVAATIAPTTDALTPQTKPTPLAPPEGTWPQILANARTKATADAQAKFDQEYGWAKAIPKQSVEEMFRISKLLTTDPVAYYLELGAELQRHPEHGQRLRSEAGRTLAGRANGEPQPDVQLIDERGQVTGMSYSAEGYAKREAWLRDQWRADLQREVGPWKQQQEATQRAALEADIKQQNEARADAVMADIAEILDYDPKAPDKTVALFQEVDQLMAQGVPAHTAALQVRKARVVPQQQQQASAQAAQTFRIKAAGQTADGRSAPSSPPKRPSNVKELSALLRSGEERG